MVKLPSAAPWLFSLLTQCLTDLSRYYAIRALTGLVLEMYLLRRVHSESYMPQNIISSLKQHLNAQAIIHVLIAFISLEKNMSVTNLQMVISGIQCVANLAYSQCPACNTCWASPIDVMYRIP